MPLPSHERRRKGFHETFERTAEETIHAMNASGSDVASQVPHHKLALDHVGVSRRAIPVRIANPFGTSEAIHLSCDVQITVGLDRERRGIHVSRMGDVLAQCTNEVYASLHDYAHRVADAVTRTQNSSHTLIKTQGTFTYLEAIRGVKQKQSLESLKLYAEAASTGKQTTTTAGVEFTHITACPCVQETFRHSYGEKGTILLQQVEATQMPFLTHSQRCLTKLSISGATKQPTLPELLEVIDAVVTRTQNTMPREFELLTVFKAHEKPQFLEDVLRDLSVALRKLLAGNPPTTRLHLSSVSMESIHDFDLTGEVSFTLAEIDQQLAKK